MKIIWNGHSCFTIDTTEGSVVLDPYKDGSVTGYGPLRLEADAVLCSHEHGDHYGVECVTLSGKPCGLSVERIATWHDEVQGAKRGSNVIHVLSAESMKIAHMGDLGCALDEGQIRQLQGLDALLIPVGGYYTIDAREADRIVQQLKPRVVIPMHYRFEQHGYDVIGTLDAFLALCNNIIEYETNTIELTPETPRQTAILRY